MNEKASQRIAIGGWVKPPATIWAQVKFRMALWLFRPVRWVRLYNLVGSEGDHNSREMVNDAVYCDLYDHYLLARLNHGWHSESSTSSTTGQQDDNGGQEPVCEQPKCCEPAVWFHPRYGVKLCQKHWPAHVAAIRGE